MRIAVWNTAFLGDAVLTVPLLRVVRAAWPEAELDYYVRGGLDALFRELPGLDHVYAYDKRGAARGWSAFRRFAREISGRRYDLWINAHPSLRSSLMAWQSGAARRVGYAEAPLSRFLFTDRVSRRFQQLQEVERVLGLLEPLTLPENILLAPALRWPELPFSSTLRREAEQLLSPLPPGPILALHPGSVWPTKRWTPEGFAHILRRTLGADANVLLLAGPGEIETAREVLRLADLASLPRGTSPRLLDLSGKTSLPVLAALLGRVQCYLTNDSGPMHLAWAQRTPVVALFGPTVRSLGFAPRGDSVIMETDEACRPCGLHGHASCPRGHFRCMRNISGEQVWQEVRRRLFPSG